MPGRTTDLFKSWIALENTAPGLLSPIMTETQHKQALQLIDALMIEIGSEPVYPLLSLLTLLAGRVEVFGRVVYPAERVSPERALAFLMEQRDLTQKRLEADTGINQNKILKGVRTMTVSQIRTLSAYFHVSPELFIA